MTCIIVDDEANARVSIKGMLEEHFPTLSIIAECENVPQAVKAINHLKPNIVFLDIEMPGQNGFELFNYFEIDSIDFKIVFVTAYSEYSLKAFEMAAIDYILKPVRLEHLTRAINKIDGYYKPKENYAVLKENIQQQIDKKIVLQTAETIYVIKLEDIIFIQAEGNYTKFHTVNQGILTITKKLSEFDYLLDLPFFFRSHRSFILHINKIKKVDKKNYVIIMSNDEQVYLAQEKKQALLDKLA
jgi:two-component system LytT family response regulator